MAIISVTNDVAAQQRRWLADRRSGRRVDADVGARPGWAALATHLEGSVVVSFAVGLQLSGAAVCSRSRNWGEGKVGNQDLEERCSKADNLLSGMFHSKYYPDKIAVRLCWVTQKANQCLIFQFYEGPEDMYYTIFVQLNTLWGSKLCNFMCALSGSFTDILTLQINMLSYIARRLYLRLNFMYSNEEQEHPYTYERQK